MTDVLIVGAGPTGLTLAAQLHAAGTTVRIVERRRGDRMSRAFLVHPRTLELLAPLGLAEAVVARGDPGARAQLHAGARSVEVGVVPPHIPDTPYPFLLPVPQAAVEEVLATHLEVAGVAVERGVELVTLEPTRSAVTSTLRHADGRHEQIATPYVVGCDGRDSRVRDAAGIAYPGRGYRARVVIADVQLADAPAHAALHAVVAGNGLLFLFPSSEGPGWRLLSVVPHDPDDPDRTPVPGPGALDGLQDVVHALTGGRMRIQAVERAEEIPLVRHQAARYRDGRVLLAGDAAHVHSPAGGQGMNTGMQDASNLGWKLALVAAGQAPEALLSSYEAERWPVARRVRQLTDLAFAAEAGDQALFRLLRAHLVPRLLPLVRNRTLPPPAFRLLGGLTTRYRTSPIVAGAAPRWPGGVHPGDRMPDGEVVIEGEHRRLHEALRAPGFHLLRLSTGPRAMPIAAAGSPDGLLEPVAVHPPGRVTNRRLSRRLGADEGCVLVVRPDGHVGFRSRGTDATGATAYLRSLAQRGIA
jgi:2-polyprenyl-6-methoxyphenol hydroxylase-like FAD-dependent oxidoreductase